MSIEIGDYTYNYEDEELDDIEYLEIMSLDEIIKDNPSFIALSENDIRDNLYNTFLNNKKANNVTKLFYEIINDINEKRGVLNNYDNYIFNAEAEKEKNDVNDKKEEEDANYFNKLEKRVANQYNKEKNKYFFCIKYNNDSTNLRFMNDKKINISLEPYHNNAFPIYYPIFPSDDINIPIISAYYKIPKSIINDNIYIKITEHLVNSKNINLKIAKDYENVKELIKDVRPDIHHIINYMEDDKRNDFNMDYKSIDSIFKKFGRSLDLINESDCDILCNYMISITEYEKERKNISRSITIKKSDILNKKLIFFDKIKSIINLIDLNDTTINFLEKTKIILEEHLSTIYIADELVNLNDIDINKLILHINQIENEDAIELLKNIKQSMHIIKIKETIEEINKILKTLDNKTEIIRNYEILKKKFEYSRNHIFDYDKDGKKYLISYREVKEIKEGKNHDNYEGIPIYDISDTINVEDQDNLADLANEEYNIKYIIDTIDINKYLSNITYKTEEGFIDGIKIILQELEEISKLCNLEIDYDILCSELFKYYRSIPSKKNSIIKEFQDKNVELNKTLLNILEKLPPKNILNIREFVNELDKDLLDIILIANNEWLSSIKEMFIHAISFWIINVQEKILDDTFPLDENYLNDNYIGNWYKYGSPFNNLKKSEDKGILPYIIYISKDYLINKNELLINIDNLLKNTIKCIEENYTTNLENMRNRYELLKDKKKEMRGLLEKDKFNTLRENKICIKNINLCKEQHVKSLIYMPDINYAKIHKFLHGCCLKKLDNTFSDDIDLKNAKRKDLIVWKKEFAKKRLTNKSRDLRFIPEKVDKIENNLKEIYSTIKEDITYDIKHSNIISLWLEKIRQKNNSLILDKDIDDIEFNAKKIINTTKNNLTILAKTSKNLKNEHFINSFYKDKIKYKSIILAIIKILNNYSKKKDNIELSLIIDTAIKDLRNILIDLNELNSILIEENEIETEMINRYIISRALCCPFNPDELVNGCLSSVIINNSIIQELAKIIYTDILKIIELKFPNAEETINFLNEQREKNKQNKINILNDKSVEENLLIKELKKAGIKYKIMNEKTEEIIENEEENIIADDTDSKVLEDIYDDNMEDIDKYDDEHKLGTYDNDSDDELMLMGDMGFIYN